MRNYTPTIDKEDLVSRTRRRWWRPTDTPSKFRNLTSLADSSLQGLFKNNMFFIYQKLICMLRARNSLDYWISLFCLYICLELSDMCRNINYKHNFFFQMRRLKPRIGISKTKSHKKAFLTPKCWFFQTEEVKRYRVF